MVGEDTFVKDFELSFLLLKENYIFGKKIVIVIIFWKRLNEHYKWSFNFRMYKMNVSSYQQREPVAINYCYHEGDLRKPYYQKKSYLTYTIMLLPVTILGLYKIIMCKLSTIYTPFLRKRNVCSHPKAKIYWNLSINSISSGWKIRKHIYRNSTSTWRKK